MKPRNNLEIVQDAIMAMYDYIDGGAPCPYDTPEEWRRHLNADALQAVAILRQRMAAEAFLPDGVLAQSPAAETPVESEIAPQVEAPAAISVASSEVLSEVESPKPAEVSATSSTVAEVGVVPETASEPDESSEDLSPLDEAKARKKLEALEKRKALRATLSRLKKKEN